jgi:CTP synthase (UTP-ammonia lyase)
MIGSKSLLDGGLPHGMIARMAQQRIGVVGEYQPNFAPHTAISSSVEHALTAAPSLPPIALQWVATSDAEHISDEELATFAGWWIAPGSPYRSIDGALKVIRYAREHDIPLLGTCGGYQHVVLEYARNVLGFADAAHAEYDPYASDLFITALSCSLVGQTMTVMLRDNTTAARLYPKNRVTERYYCNFGLNLDHLPALTAAGLVVSGTDHDGEPRILELPNLRYFLATLFVPQTSSTPTSPHPLIVGLLRAAATNAPPRHVALGKSLAGEFD